MAITDTHSVVSSGTPAAVQTDAAKKQRLQKAAKDFEALFVGYMLKSMRSTVPESSEFGDSFGGDILGSLFDTEMAKQVSKGSSLGIAETMYRKLAAGAGLDDDILESVPPSGLMQKTPVHATKHTQVHQNQSPPSQTVQSRINKYKSIIDTAAQKHGIDSTLVKAVMATESGGNVFAQSSQDAKGLMQLIDSTASDMGVKNVWNPKENIEGGVKYLKQMMDKFGDTKLAVASYNAGPAAVEKHGGIPPIKETQDYVRQVMKYWNYFQQQEAVNNEK